MAADAMRLPAALVIAMRRQQPLVEMADAGAGQVLDDDRLEIRCHGLCQHAAPRLDDPGDGQRIPQGLAEARARAGTAAAPPSDKARA
ncbi:MAG: hypothetical protein WDN03_16075 [Rhizomicrobium sp.]